MDIFFSIVDTGASVLDDFIPGLIDISNDLRNYIVKNKYDVIKRALLVGKLLTYIYTATRMGYFFFYKNKLTYRDNVPLKLILCILNITLILFVLLDIKQVFLKGKELVGLGDKQIADEEIKLEEIKLEEVRNEEEMMKR